MKTREDVLLDILVSRNKLIEDILVGMDGGSFERALEMRDTNFKGDAAKWAGLTKQEGVCFIY